MQKNALVAMVSLHVNEEEFINGSDHKVVASYLELYDKDEQSSI